MSREIKFRAWVFRYKEMRPVIEVGWLEDGKMRINAVNSLKDWSPQLNGFDSGDEFVLMQYTGLKDKNRTDIYDGDITRFTNSSGEEIDRVCRWNERVNGWRFDGIYDPKNSGFNYSQEFINVNHVEIIGNIYENPELLK